MHKTINDIKVILTKNKTPQNHHFKILRLTIRQFIRPEVVFIDRK